MKLRDYTTATGLMPRLDCQDLDEVIATLVAGLAAAGGVSETERLVADVLRREQETNTTLGGGLAVPHARSTAVDRMHIAVATLARPLHIPAKDDQPVDVVVLLVGPLHEPRQMLRLLARLARLVKDCAFLDDLRRARSAEEMAGAFSTTE